MSDIYLHKLFTSGKAPFIWEGKVWTPLVSSVRLMDIQGQRFSALLLEYRHEVTVQSTPVATELEPLMSLVSFARRGLVKQLQKVWFNKGTGIFYSTDLQVAKSLPTEMYKISHTDMVMFDAYMLESALKSLIPEEPFLVDIDNNYLYIHGKVLRKQEEPVLLYAIPYVKESHYGRQLEKKGI